MNGMPYVFNELNKDYHLLMLGHLKIEKYRESGLLLMDSYFSSIIAYKSCEDTTNGSS